MKNKKRMARERIDYAQRSDDMVDRSDTKERPGYLDLYSDSF
jgi:hypothetical protein